MSPSSSNPLYGNKRPIRRNKRSQALREFGQEIVYRQRAIELRQSTDHLNLIGHVLPWLLEAELAKKNFCATLVAGAEDPNSKMRGYWAVFHGDDPKVLAHIVRVPPGAALKHPTWHLFLSADILDFRN